MNNDGQKHDANQSSTHRTLIAIPSYGDRVLPRFDQVGEFYFAQVDLAQNTIISVTAHNPPDKLQDVGGWLSKQGVDGVICSGIHQRHQVQLQQLGIWLQWGVAGNIETVLQHWLQEQTNTVDNSHVDCSCFSTCNEPHSI